MYIFLKVEYGGMVNWFFFGTYVTFLYHWLRMLSQNRFFHVSRSIKDYKMTQWLQYYNMCINIAVIGNNMN